MKHIVGSEIRWYTPNYEKRRAAHERLKKRYQDPMAGPIWHLPPEELQAIVLEMEPDILANDEHRGILLEIAYVPERVITDGRHRSIYGGMTQLYKTLSAKWVALVAVAPTGVIREMDPMLFETMPEPVPLEELGKTE
jgi:hypothetical protein